MHLVEEIVCLWRVGWAFNQTNRHCSLGYPSLAGFVFSCVCCAKDLTVMLMNLVGRKTSDWISQYLALVAIFFFFPKLTYFTFCFNS